jgi:hypothetical protein
MAALVLYVGLLVPALLLLAAYARSLRTVGATLSGAPAQSAGLGLLVVAATPAVAALLGSTVVGWGLAVLILLAYPLMLYAGLVVVLALLGDRVLARLGREGAGWLARAAVFSVLLLVLLALAIIPVLGWIVLLAVLVLGSGAVKLHAYRLWRALPARDA